MDHQLPTTTTTAAGFGVTRAAVTLILSTVLLMGIAAVFVVLTVRIPQVVHGSGQLVPRTLYRVYATIRGEIITQYAFIGSTVVRGSVLAIQDSAELTSQRLQVVAKIKEAEIALERSRSTVADELRQRTLRVQIAKVRVVQARASVRDRMTTYGYAGSVDSLVGGYRAGSHIEMDKTVAELAGANSELLAAESDYSAASTARYDQQRSLESVRDGRVQLSLLARLRPTLHAPGSGIVVGTASERLTGRPVSPGELVFEIADTSAWRAIVSVSERDVQSVRIGDSVDLMIPALWKETRSRIRGVVESIASTTQGALELNARMPLTQSGFEVHVRIPRLRVDQIDAKLRFGYTVDARIVTESGLIAELLMAYFRNRIGGIGW